MEPAPTAKKSYKTKSRLIQGVDLKEPLAVLMCKVGLSVYGILN